MVQFLPQVGTQTPRNRLIDFSPLERGVDSVIRQGNLADARSDRQNALTQRQGNVDREFAHRQEQAEATDQYRQNALDARSSQATAGIREYNFAKQQGFPGSFVDFQTAKRKAGAPKTTINMPGLEKSFDKQMGKKLADDFVESQEIAAKSSANIGDLEILKTAIGNPDVYLGAGADTVNKLKRAGQSLFGFDFEGVADSEVIRSIGNKIAVEAKDQLPGPMSDSDRKFLVQMAPGLSKSPEGNRRLIELSMIGHQYQMNRAQVIQDYAAQRGGRLDPGVYSALGKLETDYRKQSRSILQKLRRQPRLAPRSPTAGMPQVGQIMDGWQFKGGDPGDQSNWVQR